MTWTERGGPTPHSFSSTGFGTGFLTRCVEYELGGTATAKAEESGVTWTFEFPLKNNLDSADGRRRS